MVQMQNLIGMKENGENEKTPKKRDGPKGDIIERAKGG